MAIRSKRYSLAYNKIIITYCTISTYRHESFHLLITSDRNGGESVKSHKERQAISNCFPRVVNSVESMVIIRLNNEPRARIHSISLCLTIARGYCVIASRSPQGLTLRLATNQLTIGHTCNNCDYTWNDRDYTRDNGPGKLLCHGKQLDATLRHRENVTEQANTGLRYGQRGWFSQWYFLILLFFHSFSVDL